MTDILQLTDRPAPRPISMQGKHFRRTLMLLALLCAAASVKVVASPCFRRPVAQFIYFYEQTPGLSLWDRVVYSLLLTRTTEPSS